MKLKHFLTTAASVILLSSPAFAIDNTENAPLTAPILKADLHGFMHFQAGNRNQDKLTSTEKNISQYNKDLALFNEAALVGHVSNTVGDVSYGGKIVLVPTAKKKGSNAYNGSHFYLTSVYGKVELGSSVSPVSTMSVDAGCITAGSGNWDRYANTKASIQQVNGTSPTFATGINFFMSDNLLTKLSSKPYSNEAPRSIVYYTPRFELADSLKARIGVAYTPDSSNTGADQIDTASSGLETKQVSSGTIDRFEFDNSVKNAFSGSVSLNYHFADTVDLQVGFSAEYANSVGSAKEFANATDTTPVAEYDLKNLRSYNVGAVFTYGGMAYAASYGTLGKSLTTTEYHKAGRKTEYYTAAMAYTQGPASVSLDYFRAEKFDNTADALTVGTSYKLFTGLTNYFEVSRYSLNGRPEFYASADRKRTKGVAVITGLKLKL